MNKKRWKLLLVSLFMILSLAGCSEKQSDEEVQKQFDEFIENDFIETMESDYLTMHIYLEHPENYGVDPNHATVQLGEKFNENQLEEDQSELQAIRAEFDKFNRNQLSEEQKDTYDCFEFMLALSEQADDDKFAYMGSAFNTMTGDHAQIPTLLADMVLRNEQDVKDLITLVNDVKPFLESDLAYTQKQLEEGTLMIGLDEVMEHCQGIVDAGMEGSTLSSMKQHIDELNIDEEAKTTYKQQLEDAYRNSFLPGYENVITTLSSIDASKNHTSGLANMENGKEFYEILFKQATGTDKTVDEVYKELEKQANSSYLKAIAAVSKNVDAYNDFYEGNVNSGYHDYESMLIDLEAAFQEDFPSVGKLEYNIASLPADLATGGIAAYFNIPAIDGTTKKDIHVNNTDYEGISTIDTFTTVAHEGIPGHMYQIQYAYENIKNPWRLTCTNFSGYTEGYATYVELYSLKYLNMDEDVKTISEAMSEYEHALIAMIDIGIHYKGWDLEELKDFFNENGLNEEVASEIYNQIVYNPTAFLPYYVGYQEIITMKKSAQETLGDAFSELEFNSALLKSGAAPFSVVERNIDAYVNEAK